MLYCNVRVVVHVNDVVTMDIDSVVLGSVVKAEERQLVDKDICPCKDISKLLPITISFQSSHSSYLNNTYIF